MPPTIQSLPVSPNRSSLPSVLIEAVARQSLPLLDTFVQPSTKGPSVVELVRKYWKGKLASGVLEVQV